jgi:hypothetical protein
MFFVAVCMTEGWLFAFMQLTNVIGVCIQVYRAFQFNLTLSVHLMVFALLTLKP